MAHKERNRTLLRRMLLIGMLIPGVLSLAGFASLQAQQTPASASSTSGGQSTGNAQSGQRRRGEMGGFPGGARGLLGTVTEVTADHYTVKTDSGEIYTIHFSVNTRFMKQPAGRRQPGTGPGSWANRTGTGNGGAGNDSGDVERAMPQPLKPSEIKVGDVITAGGEMDTSAKSVGAIFIMQVDPERAKQMREMQANYGKTWLAGRITAIDGTRITIEGIVDHAPHQIDVDENTSFRQRRESITLGDIEPGEQLRADGAMKNGVFLATTVNASQPREDDGAGAKPTSATPK